MAGFGTFCITPPLPCRLGGYSRREGLSRRVAQQLWARSIVLDNGDKRVGWVICDLLEVDRSLVANVREAIGATACLPGDDVLVGATHTHAGPDLSRHWDLDGQSHHGAQERYRSFLPHAIASAVVAAVEDLSPSSLTWAEGSISGVGTDRRGSTDLPQKLGVLRAIADDQLKGMVIIHPCHGTVLGPDNLAVSGDIIGGCIGALESSTGAIGRCAWAQGAAGDISTRASRRERSHREVDRLGSLVAEAAEQTAAGARPLQGGQLDLRRGLVTLPTKSAEQWVVQEVPSPTKRDESDRSEAALIEEAMAARSGRRGRGPLTEDVAEVSSLRIGRVTLCFVPGEPFQSIERALMERSGVAGLRVVGYSNGAPGYIFSPDEEAEGGYEVISSPLTAEAGTRIVDVAADLVGAGATG